VTGSRGTRAQSLVEFAIVVPVFLLVLFGLIDFSRLLFSYVSLTNGARELARNLAISTTTPTTSSAAFNNLTVIAGGTQPATSVTVTLSVGGGNGSVTCARNSPLLCTISLTTTPNSTNTNGAVSLTTQPNSGSANFTATRASGVGITTTGNGDFVTQSWMATDGTGWLQGYVQVCQLPLSASCGLPTFASARPQNWFTNGFVQVNLGYTFQFNPLFQNKLAGVVDVSFMRASTLVTTTVRSYAE
jgi:Flp pilus assembly protein TadG